MSTTLNEKIVACIDYRNIRNFDREAFQSFNANEIEVAATQIEILVLNSQVELLTKYRDEFMNRFLTSSAASLDKEISELNNKIKELTK